MEYKLTENDLQWRPQYAFDEASKKWILTVSVSYHLLLDISPPLLGTPARIVPTIPKTPEWAKMKKGVYSCSNQPSRNWTPEDSQSWDQFFSEPTYSALSAFVTSLNWLQDSSEPAASDQGPAENTNHAPVMIASNHLQLAVCPEPLICTSSAAAAAWSSSRHQNGTAVATPVPQDDVGTRVALGDIVVIVPDDESRANDIVAGYTIPISFGKVTGWSVDKPLVDATISVKWLYSASINDKFSVWVVGGQEIVDTILFSTLQKRSDGSVITMKFTRAGKLTAASRVLLEPILAEDYHGDEGED